MRRHGRRRCRRLLDRCDGGQYGGTVSHVLLSDNNVLNLASRVCGLRQ